MTKNFKKILTFFFSLVLFSSISTTALAASPQLGKSQILETKSITTTSNSKYVVVRTTVPVYTSGGKAYGQYNYGDIVPYFTDSEGYSGQVKCLDVVRSPEYIALTNACIAGTYYSTNIEYIFGGTVTKAN
jgi:hypothetical protein